MSAWKIPVSLLQKLFKGFITYIPTLPGFRFHLCITSTARVQEAEKKAEHPFQGAW